MDSVPKKYLSVYGSYGEYGQPQKLSFLQDIHTHTFLYVSDTYKHINALMNCL